MSYWIELTIFAFSINSQHWDGASDWEPSSWKTMIDSSSMLLIIALPGYQQPLCGPGSLGIIQFQLHKGEKWDKIFAFPVNDIMFIWQILKVILYNLSFPPPPPPPNRPVQDLMKLRIVAVIIITVANRS